MPNSTSNITVRRAIKADFRAIAEIFVDAIENKASEFYNAEQVAAWSASAENVGRWEEKIEQHYFMVAIWGDEVVGFASLFDCEIDTVYVHTAHHRKGIATLLFDDLINEAQRKGCKKLVSHVSEAAKPFFVHKGFTVLQKDTFDMRGVEIWNYSVEMELG